ncbi:induced myeloid leukemia cell differentiation protein Mcl-1 homolog [Heteronotia binoei]|uniref:induced myeloid leukemia cell differentiation protein Mcl-1 homolog n=1 Tax=Heteronotia binoei TaxID=13085 RepID=UPI0029302B1E|nr:induced myeloid leukemia cell differentiation protein Mcl-1 homolog [Heteronotia binoei]
MLSLKQKMIGLNLYCGGAPAVAPSSPGVAGQSPSGGEAAPLRGHPGPWPPSDGARALIGGGPRAGAPRSLIGPLEGAPRALIGWPRAPSPSRPSKLPLPEDELDGVEPEAAAEEEEEEEEAAVVPSPTASLPSSDEDEAEAARGDELRAETLEVVLRYLLDVADAAALAAKAAPARPGAPRVARAVQTLRRVGDGVLGKHQMAFQGMLKKLEIKNQDDLKSVSEVAMHVFSDGVTNWGRILTLISFGGFVAKHLKSINQESNIIPLAEIITDVLVKDKREWLVSHNAWEGFVKFFHVEDIEGSIRNVLMAFASVAGIGAGLAYMIR